MKRVGFSPFVALGSGYFDFYYVLFWDNRGLTTDGGLLLGVGSQKLGFVVFCFGLMGD